MCGDTASLSYSGRDHHWIQEKKERREMRMSYLFMSPEMIEEQTRSFEYIRGEENAPIGVVVLDNEMRVGWSLYNEKHEDQPASKDKGIFIALNRAKSVSEPVQDLMTRLEKAYSENDRLQATILCVGKMIRRKNKILSNEGDDE